ncbi:uncharacterized protein FFFS_15794 [Fusarium fujikuroi]|nr:uncharacterized protein FFFS_15794 [Fusarium fujikuroi]
MTQQERYFQGVWLHGRISQKRREARWPIKEGCLWAGGESSSTTEMFEDRGRSKHKVAYHGPLSPQTARRSRPATKHSLLCKTLGTQEEADVSSCQVSQQVEEGDISLNAVKNEFSRFQLWCLITGANEEGPSSLDDGLQLYYSMTDILDGQIIPWDQSHLSESDDDNDDDDDDART